LLVGGVCCSYAVPEFVGTLKSGAELATELLNLLREGGL
jgi:hypothetical protein